MTGTPSETASGCGERILSTESVTMLRRRMANMNPLGKIALLAALITVVRGAALCAQPPDFGPNVLVFNPSMPAAVIQQQIDKVYAIQQHSEFGSARYALLFLPGDYHVDVPIGFYTQVVGLGAAPDAVHISGNVHADASLPRNNATCTFWRGVEGFSVTPTGGTMQWAVSQAVPFRRMHIVGSLVLHQNGGWASGGWMSDALVDGNVGSGSQQQWIARNSEWGSWTGSNWNMVFVGDVSAPAGEWPSPPYTKVARVPVVREKPFLFVDERGKYFVRVPALRTSSEGITWRGGTTPGRSVPLDRFFIAHPGDTAATLNAQLAAGRNLLLTPGTYELTEPIRIERPNTVVLGLGFATLKPVNGTAVLTTADADGIVVAGLLIDAGPQQSAVLVEIGPEGKPRQPRAESDLAARCVLSRGRCWCWPRDREPPGELERHDHRSHVDLARRSRRRRGMESKC